MAPRAIADVMVLALVPLKINKKEEEEEEEEEEGK